VISYAQNLEDVVLSRLTRFVPAGTYVDVGAGHPVLENATYWLYSQGWRGINVEPMGREVGLLRETRPEDVTIEAAAGAARGTITLYEAPLENRGGTTSDLQLAERYRSEGQDFRAFDAALRTLDDILDEYPLQPLHLLKVDVEGSESEVLAGFDLRRHRPWVLVVEATIPNSRLRAPMPWEPHLLASGYVHTLFDGLNNFYVRDDMPEIAEALSAPANVFDGWIPAQLHRLQAGLEEAAERSAEFERRLADAAVYAKSLEAALVRAEAAERWAEFERRLADATTYAKSLEVAVARAESHARALESAAQEWATERQSLLENLRLLAAQVGPTDQGD
jgi:FkbM family methyltransferase